MTLQDPPDPGAARVVADGCRLLPSRVELAIVWVIDTKQFRDLATRYAKRAAY